MMPSPNPVLQMERLRQVRTGRSHLLRAGCVFGVLLGIGIIYAERFGLRALLEFDSTLSTQVSPGTLARFSQQMAFIFLFVQALAIILLTPPCMAGAIAEERERGSLPLLLTSLLTTREILLGKLLARLAPLIEMLLAGIPVMALLLLLGGVSWQFLIAGYAVLGITLLSYGSICLAVSVQVRNLTAAVWCSYLALVIQTLVIGAIGGFLMISWWGTPLVLPSASPLLLLAVLDNYPLTKYGDRTLWMLAIYFGVHLLTTLLSLDDARRELRRYDPAKRGPEKPAVRFLRVLRPRQQRQPVPPKKWPPVTEEPIVWKDRRSRLVPAIRIGYYGAVVVAFLFVGTGLLLSKLLGRTPNVPPSELVHGFLAVYSCIGLAGLCLPLAFQAATAIVQEKVGRTWESLLALPLRREELLGAKVKGCLLAYKPLVGDLLLLLGVGLVAQLFSVGYVCLLLLHGAALLFFLTMLGFCISLYSRSPLQAQGDMSGWLVVIFVGGWFLHCSPLHAWWFLLFSGNELLAPNQNLLPEILGSILVYVIGGLLAALLARRWCRRGE
jgi:ABC-type Na+ efflux pump permease subunit